MTTTTTNNIAAQAVTVYLVASGTGDHTRTVAAIKILETLEQTGDVEQVRGWVEKRYATLSAAAIKEAQTTTMFRQELARVAG